MTPTTLTVGSTVLATKSARGCATMTPLAGTITAINNGPRGAWIVVTPDDSSVAPFSTRPVNIKVVTAA